MEIRKIKSAAVLTTMLFLALLVLLAPAAISAQLLKPGEVIYSRATQGGNCLTAAIWVVGQDGSNDRFITFGLHPRISPDGRFILFKRFSFNTACAPFTNGAPEFWIRNIATGRETQISQNFGISEGAYFSPDTNRADKQIIFDDADSICTINVDGTNKVCIVPPGLSPIDSPGHMSVRGDGLTVMQNFGGRIAQNGIYTLNYNDFSNIQKIPNTIDGDVNPAWSNDGQTIAYAFSPRGRAQPYWFTNLFKINPDGSNKTQLTFANLPPSGEGFSFSLVWTKDNSTILNAAKINGVAGIYKISASGGGILGTIPITPGAAPEWVGGIVPVYSEQQTASFGGGLTGGGNYSLVDTVGQAFAGQSSANGSYNLQSGFWTNLPSAHAPFDFDGDGKTDVSIFRPSLGEWWYLKSSTLGNAALQFGTSTDKLVPGDFTGDGKTDIAFFRPSTGFWFVLRSEDNSFFSFPFGTNGDVPVPADYDGDGKTDPAVFRPSTNTWFISLTSGGTSIQQFGAAGDAPAVADYDGDGKADIAIFRPATGEWWIQRSTAGLIAFQFGNGTDKPVQGDYTGDGKADAAFFRPSTGFWFILRSEDNSFFSAPFGTSGDIPAPGDYDGDGKFDLTVFRPSNSTWFIQRSTAGTQIVSFGTSGDRPVPNAFVP